MELFRQLVHGRTDGRTLLVPKVAIATENSQKISEKNESRSCGPWQKIDFFVKYSPVYLCFNASEIPGGQYVLGIVLKHGRWRG